MEKNFYGAIAQSKIKDEIERYVESIAIQGYAIVPHVLPESELSVWRHKIDTIYAQQEKAFGKEALVAIQDADNCRAPILYDFDFTKIAGHPTVLAVVQKILGDSFILDFQNALIGRPNMGDHHTWHRDVSYQNVDFAEPSDINALWAIDDLVPETWAAHLLPGTHRRAKLPSAPYIKDNQLIARIPAGSVIIFDSRLFHRAGPNLSTQTIRVINHVYGPSTRKQLYDYPRALAHLQGKVDPALERLLGFTSMPYSDDMAVRLAKAAQLRTK